MMTQYLSVTEKQWDTDTQALLYLALKACGRADQIFYRGHDLKWFLEEASSGLFIVATVYDRVVGFGMSKDSEGDRNGILTFGFLPSASVWQAVSLSKMMLSHLFNTSHYDRVYGFTANNNLKAVQFARRVGMDAVAQIPDYIAPGIDAIVTYTNREKWKSRPL